MVSFIIYETTKQIWLVAAIRFPDSDFAMFVEVSLALTVKKFIGVTDLAKKFTTEAKYRDFES